MQSHKSCPPCSDGKAIRAPFEQNEQNRYSLLEAVSSDTTGPIPLADTDGNKYIQIVVGACSGCSDVQIMKKTSGARDAIIRSLTKIQRNCDFKAKSLHTDGAKKQDTKKLKNFSDARGSATSHTAPNAIQSNAFAERRFRQLMAAARTAMAAASHMPKNMWSYAVLYAADKGNYLATAKRGKLQAIPNANTSLKFPSAKIASPSCYLPCGKEWKLLVQSNSKRNWKLEQKMHATYES